MSPREIGVQAASLHASYEFYFGPRKGWFVVLMGQDFGPFATEAIAQNWVDNFAPAPGGVIVDRTR